MKMTILKPYLMALFVTILLTACGGGGSSDNPPPPVNTTPTTKSTNYIEISQIGTNELRIGWYPIEGATGYSLERSDNGGEFKEISTGDQTFYDDTDILTDTTYTYRLNILNGSNQSLYGTEDVLLPGDTAILVTPAQTVASLMNFTTPETSVKTVKAVLAAAGVGTLDNDVINPGQYPVVTWLATSYSLFDMSMEVAYRADTGRYTLSQVATMLQDVGFPFLGSGTAEEQLLNYLRGLIEHAQAAPLDQDSFIPLLVRELALNQSPAFDYLDTSSNPNDLRLTLFELELIAADFVREIDHMDIPPVPAEPTTPKTMAMKTGTGPCSSVVKPLGPVTNFIGGKVKNAVTKEYRKQLLKNVFGLSDSATKALNSHYSNAVKALNILNKISRMLQLYANGAVMLTIEGANPIHKPHKGESRRLIGVNAVAGVSDEAWAEYQKTLRSKGEYQGLKDCFSTLGIPMPPDLSDIANDAGNWRVKWDIVSGLKHVRISQDVNDFIGNDITAMTSNGTHSATSRLNVDIREESEFASLFNGPIETGNAVIKAEVLTAKPPDPTTLLKLTSLIGTVSALTDIVVGWIETGMPPSNKVNLGVEFHKAPDAIQATMNLDAAISIDDINGALIDMQGNYSAILDHIVLERINQEDFEYYKSAETVFNYTNVSGFHAVMKEQCTESYEEQFHPVNGQFAAYFGQQSNWQNGNAISDAAMIFNYGNYTQAESPKEKYDLYCDGDSSHYDTAYIMYLLESYFDLTLFNSSSVPGISFGTGFGWVLQQDNSWVKKFTGSRTWPLLGAPGGVPVLINENTEYKLLPIFSSPVP